MSILISEHYYKLKLTLQIAFYHLHGNVQIHSVGFSPYRLTGPKPRNEQTFL